MEKDTLSIRLINQLFILDKKLASHSHVEGLQRPVGRMRELLEEGGFYWLNPIGEPYPETRSDCEASIAGEKTQDLTIVEVLKPIIYWKSNQEASIVQKGVVIVEGK